MKADRIAAVLLGFAAGYVDGCTFVALFGLFVAQVTGSFVVAGAALVVRESGLLIKVLAIPAFLLGAAVTTALAFFASDRRVGAVALGLECLLLLALLATGTLWALGDPDQPAAVAAGVFGLTAMGIQSAFVRLFLPVMPSTNVMTTNTTQAAIDATVVLLARLPGNQRRDEAIDPVQARARLARTAPIMAAFLAGTLAGAAACHRFGFVTLVTAVLILTGLMIRTTRGGPNR